MRRYGGRQKGSTGFLLLHRLETRRDSQNVEILELARARTTQRTFPSLSDKQQAVIGGLLSLSRVQTRESGEEADTETVKLPREPAKKTLAQLNPDNFPPDNFQK